MTQDHHSPDRRLEGETAERRVDHQQRYLAFARRSTWILAAIVVITLVNAGVSTYLLWENKERTSEIANTLVESCEANGNPLRGVVRHLGATLIDQIQDDRMQQKALQRAGVYRDLFPSYDPEKLNALLTASRRKDLRLMEELREANKHAAPVNCEKKFGR